MTITTPPPLGVDQRWLNRAKKNPRSQRDARHQLQARNVQALEQFIKTGLIILADADPVLKPPGPIVVSPPRRDWERHLDTFLESYAIEKQLDFELNTLCDGTWDRDAAHAAVSAQKLASMIQFHAAALFPVRFEGRVRKTIWPNQVAYAALEIVLGVEDDAYEMARLYLEAFRRGWVQSPDFFPLYVFMFRLLADHLGQAPLDLVGEPLWEPFTNALFNEWRTPDPTVLVPLCLAVCDFHTHRCKPDKGDTFHEFTEGAWTRCPIEILLLFKLRELNGLTNPNLDHPLINSALGQLPPNGLPVTDLLLARVHQRLVRDGFKEAFGAS